MDEKVTKRERGTTVASRTPSSGNLCGTLTSLARIIYGCRTGRKVGRLRVRRTSFYVTHKRRSFSPCFFLPLSMYTDENISNSSDREKYGNSRRYLRLRRPKRAAVRSVILSDREPVLLNADTRTRIYMISKR